MSASNHAAEQRKLRSIARRYERDGYRVTMPRQGGGLPAFLEGFTPDLIAESENERVVLEVKRSDAVPGSNDLLEIAERVARQPGWRFELVTVPAMEQVSVPTAERMDLIRKRAREALKFGLTDVAYAYAWTAVEEILREMALQNGVKVAKVSFGQALRALAFQGVISGEVLDTIEQARSVRSGIVHGKSETVPSAHDVDGLLALAWDLRSELAAAASS